MNHYQKLALVLLRVLSIVFVLLGLFGFAPYLYFLLQSQDPVSFLAGGVYILSYAAYAVAGLVMFALSKPIAALIARKL